MSVLNDIFEWSLVRPEWQRDALRRLVEKGELTEQDISELTEICKNVHGLGEQREAIPLSKNHIPKPGEGLPKVVLTSISHERGVNALAEKQTLDFKEGLTVIYGANAAGKSGYTRILKTACRTRGREAILGNVFASKALPSPEVAIRYRVGSKSESCWSSPQEEDDDISRVSVFDTKSASVYLNEETDVAFRPFGLDLFDKLVQACNDVKSKLSEEQSRFASKNRLSVVQTEVPEGTDVAKRLSEISDRTNPEEFKELARLSSDEEDRLASLEKTVQACKANNPDKQIRKMEASAKRFRKLGRQLQEAEDKLSDDAISALYTARSELLRKNEEAKQLQKKMFSVGYLAGTGLEKWLELWKSACGFSEGSAYPDQAFPVVGEGARCVLCQQQLDHDAGQRLLRFQKFVELIVEAELQELRQKIENWKIDSSQSGILDDETKKIIREINAESKDTGDAVLRAFKEKERRRRAVVVSLDDKDDTSFPSDLPKLAAVADKMENLAQQLDERVVVLHNNEIKEDQEREFQELHARKILIRHLSTVLVEIERIKTFAAYKLCMKDTTTQAITKKNTDVTETAVTERLKKNFQEELKSLYSVRIDVEIKKARGRGGVLYHKLILSAASHSNSNVGLQQVASEGEQRCLSIAAFLAELRIADDHSGIVFDDPVSSLDYEWRGKVAQRLVAEAQKRQVIVFTHDIVFLYLLENEAKEKSVSQHNMRVKAGRDSAGICDQELPWIALSVKERIKWLNKQSEAAAKQHETGDQSGYEKEASSIYGSLRETWERAVEQVLLSRVVERFRFGVQTQQLFKIADITRDDCREVEVAMTKCSKLLTGHDTAPAAGPEFPDPDELKADIGKLKNWVKDIHRRREH